jgi:ABC-2 type transport system permease protein
VIAVELRKLALRPRTWISVAMLCALPAIVAGFLAVTKVGPRPGDGPAFLAAVLSNGQLYPAAALGIVLPVFLPIAVSVVAGEAVAGEAATGTLRYLLARPVGRTRLLLSKLVAVAAYTLAAVLAVALTGYVCGVAVLGTDTTTIGTAPTTVSGTPLTQTQLMLRTGLMLGYIAFSMLGVASVALFGSTLTDSPLAAALGALGVLVGSTVLVGLDAAASVRDWLPTRYWLAWVDLFRDPIAWHDVSRGVAVQAVWTAVMLAAAWANFATRDVTS